MAAMFPSRLCELHSTSDSRPTHHPDKSKHVAKRFVSFVSPLQLPGSYLNDPISLAEVVWKKVQVIGLERTPWKSCLYDKQRFSYIFSATSQRRFKKKKKLLAN